MSVCYTLCYRVCYTAKNGRTLLDNPCEMDYTTNRKGAGCKMVSTYSGSKKIDLKFVRR